MPANSWAIWKPDVTQLTYSAISIDSKKTTSKNPRSTVGTADRNQRLPPFALCVWELHIVSMGMGAITASSVGADCQSGLELPERQRSCNPAPIVRKECAGNTHF